MTNKQFEHLGRAVVCEAKLEAMRTNMDELCNELESHFATFVGHDAAVKWMNKRYGQNLSMFAGGHDFMTAIRDIIENENKKEYNK